MDYIKEGLILVTGPSRSGKSEWAEKIISKHKRNVYYIATSKSSNDKQWLHRIAIHKARRPSKWLLIENSDNLSEDINNIKKSSSILIDSLGGFVSTHIHSDNSDWHKIRAVLLSSITKSNSLIVIVIEETGWSVVPTTELGNRFRDRLGELSNMLQLICSESWLVIQGRAINLKDISIPI